MDIQVIVVWLLAGSKDISCLHSNLIIVEHTQPPTQ